MKKCTREWIEKAEKNLAVALSESKQRERANDVICFLCQHTVEFYLKALLQEWAIPPPRTHDLDELHVLMLPIFTKLKPVRRQIKHMTIYAVRYRYPGAKSTRRQATAAVQLARNVRSIIRRTLGLPAALPRR